MAHPHLKLAGIAFGAGAGALWGLVFLAPELVRDFDPLQLTVGRYLFYGLISAILIAPRWKALTPHLARREWFALCWLSLAGNVLYYLLLSKAIQTGGIAVTSLVIGFLPVAVTIIGSRHHEAVPLTRLLPSIALCCGGAICIGWQALALPASESVMAQVAGLLFAIGALVSWTCYAVGNRRWLERLHHFSVHDWNLLTGVVTGLQSLVLVPVAVAVSTAHSGAAWTRFTMVSAGVAVLASIVGNALWNKMSRLLPLTLVGQMILFETLFALIYGFLWEQRLPTMLEAAAFILVVASVLSCLAAHRKRVMVPLAAA
ncbi:DMT family transporter [Sphingobium sp. EP60837]|uniref:DMT family transporter n=1 Tax=Sphingobium sp. EP60837 TaxID=1855519 RepID=UPI0007DD7232|nr:DMT family transporter [Sphingobium sp. EP60837]ANI79109.1 Inner membrane protein YtfF [Sphingobium sp. EP60837]